MIFSLVFCSRWASLRGVRYQVCLQGLCIDRQDSEKKTGCEVSSHPLCERKISRKVQPADARTTRSDCYEREGQLWVMAEVHALQRRRLHHADHVVRAGMWSDNNRHLQAVRHSSCRIRRSGLTSHESGFKMLDRGLQLYLTCNLLNPKNEVTTPHFDSSLRLE